MPIDSNGKRVWRMSEEKFEALRESNSGLCILCGARTEGGVEPDAHGYECWRCTDKGVTGIEDLLIEGRIIITS